MADPPIATPSIGEQFLYLSGLRHTDGNDRLWLQRLLTTTPQFKLGVLTALPNALIVMAFGVVSLVVLRDNTTAYIMLGGAPLVVLVGALVPSFTRTRANRLMRKNSLPPL